MRTMTWLFGLAVAIACTASMRAQAPAQAPTAPDAVRTLVSRLELERYKATIKGLTEFGIAGRAPSATARPWTGSKRSSRATAAPPNASRYDFSAPPPRPTSAAAGPRPAPNPNARAVGGGRPRGQRARTGVNTDPMRQPDERLRALNSEPATNGPRELVYCTKVGTSLPGEMYIIGAHMDGHGWGEAANDDGSGTALVMELARIFSMPDVTTERTIRFALWNNEETGLNGARAYVEQRKALQGREDPPGSGRYPEPRWLGMIQHDMMLFDHGAPRADGTVSPDQRPEADVNIEFQSNSRMAADSQKLAWFLHAANAEYATDYPAQVGPHMTNTDSTPFMDEVAAVSMRENERGVHVGSGWDPHWHQPTDIYATFSDQDFLLGLNAGQTTLSGVAQLTGAKLKP